MREAVVDANTLLRFLTNEPATPAERVAGIFDAAERHRVDLIVSSLTLAEVVYVLESVYKRERRAIADGLIELLTSGVFHFLEHDVLLQALTWYRDVTQVHFADAYVAAVAAARGHGHVISFERAMQRLGDVTLIQSADALQSETA